MTPDQRAAILALLRLSDDLPEHRMVAEGVPFVSGPVWRQRVSYAVPGKRLSAWLLRPSAGHGPWPGVLALHPHGDRFHLGGDEVAGQCGQREHHYGAYLASRGFCVLCPDLPCFGQQVGGQGMPEGHRFEELCLSRNLVVGRSLLAETLDQLRCAGAALLDYERTANLHLAAVGYGMGARAAAWLAWCDQRFGAVWMHAGLGQLRILLDQGKLLPRHTMLPGLLALGVDQADVVADLLPRSLGISLGKGDRIATQAAVAPVLTAARTRAATQPQARLEIVEGDYDHRFPAEVQTLIADRLLAWMH